MNLGLGASLVLLLSKSAVELNKMVELRAQMEALVSEIRQASRYREEEEKQAASHPTSAAAAAVAGPATSQESDGGSSATTTAVKDPIAFPAADADADAASNCSRTAVVMDLMEAELQAELSRMQQQRGRGGTVVHGHGGDSRIAPTRGLEVRAERKITTSTATAVRHHVRRRTSVRRDACSSCLLLMSLTLPTCRQLPLLKVKTKGDAPADSASRSCVDYDDGGCDKHDDNDEVDGEGEEDDDGDEEEDEEDEEYGEDRMSPPHGGVSARALERRLHELLQKRQQDRIVELESALDSAQRRLHEKEREVVWWRDAAKLVSHRRDESRRIATASAR